jgi:hypothetical protein
MSVSIKIVKANLVDEETSRPSNQAILLVLPVEGKKLAKGNPEVFGYLTEYEGQKECRYPFFGRSTSTSTSGKSTNITLDFGTSLEDDTTPEGKAEKQIKPAGYRYFSLSISEDVFPGKLITVNGGVDERDVYKITTVTDFK